MEICSSHSSKWRWRISRGWMRSRGEEMGIYLVLHLVSNYLFGCSACYTLSRSTAELACLHILERTGMERENEKSDSIICIQSKMNDRIDLHTQSRHLTRLITTQDDTKERNKKKKIKSNKKTKIRNRNAISNRPSTNTSLPTVHLSTMRSKKASSERSFGNPSLIRQTSGEKACSVRVRRRLLRVVDRCCSIASRASWRRSSWSGCEIAKNDSRLLRRRNGLVIDGCAYDCHEKQSKHARNSLSVKLTNELSSTNFQLSSTNESVVRSSCTQRKRRTIVLPTATSSHILQPLEKVLIVHLAPLTALIPRYDVESLSVAPLVPRSIPIPPRAERVDRSERPNRARRRRQSCELRFVRRRSSLAPLDRRRLRTRFALSFRCTISILVLIFRIGVLSS